MYLCKNINHISRNSLRMRMLMPKSRKEHRTHGLICNCMMCMPSHLSPKNIQRHKTGLKATMVNRTGMESVMAFSVLTAGKNVNMLTATGVSEESLPQNNQETSFQYTAIPELTLQAQWKSSNEEKATAGKDANVFGSLGVLVISISEQETIHIPKMHALAVPSKILEKYGVTLIPLSQTFILEQELDPSLKKLFLVQYNFSSDYINNYVMKLNGGGGLFVETHPFPQLFTPLSKDCSGALIVGTGDKSKGTFNFIALEIPFGYTLKIAPNVIHGDSFFIGPYAIALTDTELADSVLFRQSKPHPESTMVRGIQHVELRYVPASLLASASENHLIQQANKQTLQEKVTYEFIHSNNKRMFFQSLPGSVKFQLEIIHKERQRLQNSNKQHQNNLSPKIAFALHIEVIQEEKVLAEKRDEFISEERRSTNKVNKPSPTSSSISLILTDIFDFAVALLSVLKQIVGHSNKPNKIFRAEQKVETFETSDPKNYSGLRFFFDNGCASNEAIHALPSVTRKNHL